MQQEQTEGTEMKTGNKGVMIGCFDPAAATQPWWVAYWTVGRISRAFVSVSGKILAQGKAAEATVLGTKRRIA
jgi:hypothetical protein